MIHEQHFYSASVYYGSDYANRIAVAVGFLQKDGFESCFFEEMVI